MDAARPMILLSEFAANNELSYKIDRVALQLLQGAEGAPSYCHSWTLKCDQRVWDRCILCGWERKIHTYLSKDLVTSSFGKWLIAELFYKKKKASYRPATECSKIVLKHVQFSAQSQHALVLGQSIMMANLEQDVNSHGGSYKPHIAGEEVCGLNFSSVA